MIKVKRINNMFHQPGYKHGIKILYNFYQAIELDREIENLLWADAMAKDKSKVYVEMKFLNPGERTNYR